jgi:hypothetical protein
MGEVNNGFMEGRGTLAFKDGSVYQGDFIKNLMHGEGERTWSNGNKYRGSWKMGLREGSGVMTLTNGDKLEGEFHKDKILRLERCHSLGIETPCGFLKKEV